MARAKSLDGLFQRLWADFCRLNPHALKIHDLLQKGGEKVVNDHIAFRTFDDPRVNVQVLAQRFTALGYVIKDEYIFTEKKLKARHLEHPDVSQPLIFISELRLELCSPRLRELATKLVAQVPPAWLAQWDLPAAGRPWQCSYGEYEELRKESEYAAWLAAFGYCANHFTVSVNALKNFPTLQSLNQFLKQNGFELNSAGGEIKGSPDVLLEQSSTLAGKVEVQFSDGPQMIPACYYEFARRYPGPDGKLFRGFVEKSADKIFQSTDKR